MSKRRNYRNDEQRRFVSGLVCDMDDSMLELLCEDGFLESAELQKADGTADALALIRLALRRGFPARLDALQNRELLWERLQNSLCAWKDIVSAHIHLRAPPMSI